MSVCSRTPCSCCEKCSLKLSQLLTSGSHFIGMGISIGAPQWAFRSAPLMEPTSLHSWTPAVQLGTHVAADSRFRRTVYALHPRAAIPTPSTAASAMQAPAMQAHHLW
jgi:6-phosphogluconate dehydrogenase